MSNIIAAAGLTAAAGASGVGLARLLEVQRSKLERRHHQRILDSIKAGHQTEMKADSVLESIETWCDTHKEILTLEGTTLAEAEHGMFLHATWGAGARCCACVPAKAADRAKVVSIKRRVRDLKRMNNIGIGAWLVQINKDIIDWQITRRNARMAKCKAIWISAMQCPKSWHCCAPSKAYTK